MSELHEAIKAIKAGDKTTGRRLLMQFVQVNPRNETAWLWLAAVVTEPEQKQQYLQKVLAINPDNVTAKQGLAQLRANETTEEPPTLEDIVTDVCTKKPVSDLKPLSSARTNRSASQAPTSGQEQSSQEKECDPFVVGLFVLILGLQVYFSIYAYLHADYSNLVRGIISLLIGVSSFRFACKWFTRYLRKLDK
jgi:hypothetical protein